MVGSLKYLSLEKWDLKNFKIFKSKKRQLCAPPAPACGLYLKYVNLLDCFIKSIIIGIIFIYEKSSYCLEYQARMVLI